MHTTPISEEKNQAVKQLFTQIYDTPKKDNQEDGDGDVAEGGRNKNIIACGGGGGVDAS